MQDWAVIVLVAFGYSLLLMLINKLIGYSEMQRRTQELMKRMKESPEEISQDELMQHLVEMNKKNLTRLVLVFIVFYPIYYYFSSRYGDVQTPFGTVYWLWLFIGASIAFGMIIGGVRKWLAR